MARFLVHVELHGADDDDYERLDEAMKSAGFKNKVKDDAGEKYRLPSGRYRMKADLTANDVLDRAERAAKTTGKSFALLVSVAERWVWRGLEKV